MALAITLRKRKMALKVLVRTRRWGMVRRNSSVWRFFCRGYSPGQVPSTVTALAFTSTPLRSLATRVPSTLREVPIGIKALTSGMTSLSSTICRCLSDVPSLSSRNATFLESREVRTQPHTVTSVPM